MHFIDIQFWLRKYSITVSTFCYILNIAIHFCNCQSLEFQELDDSCNRFVHRRKRIPAVYNFLCAVKKTSDWLYTWLISLYTNIYVYMGHWPNCLHFTRIRYLWEYLYKKGHTVMNIGVSLHWQMNGFPCDLV